MKVHSDIENWMFIVPKALACRDCYTIVYVALFNLKFLDHFHSLVKNLNIPFSAKTLVNVFYWLKHGYK